MDGVDMPRNSEWERLEQNADNAAEFLLTLARDERVRRAISLLRQLFCK